jgi:hypothetical protein
MNLSPAGIAVAVTSIALVACLAAIMVQRRLYRPFPLFFLYICYAIAALTLGTAAGLSTGSTTFINIYWVSEAIYTVAGFCAMYESFRKVLRVYYPFKHWFFLIPVVPTMAILALSTWSLRKHAPIQADPLGVLYLSFFVAADYMLSALFGLFVILAFIWQARWQRYPFAIMKGFAFFSIVGMLADLLRSQFGARWDFFFSYAPAVAYILGCLIWLGAFLAPQERTSPAGPGSALDLDEIQQLLGKLTKVIK